MRIALVVPGGVDRSGEYRVIPALLSLISRLSGCNDVHVFALRQEARAASWELAGARIHNIGNRFTVPRAIGAILTEHRRAPFQIVHAIWSGAPGFVAVTAAGLLRLPSIVHVAGGELAALPEIGYGGALTWRGRIRERAVLRAATLVTAASTPMIDSLARLGIAARRIPLGADLKVWELLAPRRRDISQPARLIHVASLNRVKDQATLLQALALVAAMGLKFEMHFVGEDTLQGQIQALSDSLRLTDIVRFHGFISQRHLPQLVRESHLLIISSRHEAGPLAVLEAAALGVPTVGTAVGHIVEFAPDAAVLAPVGDAAALAHAIARVLLDEESRLRLAQAAFRRAEKHDAEFTALSFQHLYSRLATRDGLRGRTDADVGF
jgi:glycosyltransferase involved in cell wall biosynthesis